MTKTLVQFAIANMVRRFTYLTSTNNVDVMKDGEKEVGSADGKRRKKRLVPQSC